MPSNRHTRHHLTVRSVTSSSMVLGAEGGMDIGGIITQIAGGGMGGAIVLVIVGIVKKALSK